MAFELRPMETNTSGTGNANVRKSHLTNLNLRSEAPWKYSRVLNEPAMEPWAFCSIRLCRTPIAVSRVDLCRMRELRIRLALRVTKATTVEKMAQPPKKSLRGEPCQAAKAAASKKPDEIPSNV